jgi:hypothetical protein
MYVSRGVISDDRISLPVRITMTNLLYLPRYSMHQHHHWLRRPATGYSEYAVTPHSGLSPACVPPGAWVPQVRPTPSSPTLTNTGTASPGD